MESINAQAEMVFSKLDHIEQIQGLLVLVEQWVVRGSLLFLINQYQQMQQKSDTMKINPNEKEIKGNWFSEGQKVSEDDACRRIYWLRDNYLNRLASDASGWDVLYQDPADMRYWEIVYEHSEMHGGGPPSLIQLSKEEAIRKYNIKY